MLRCKNSSSGLQQNEDDSGGKHSCLPGVYLCDPGLASAVRGAQVTQVLTNSGLQLVLLLLVAPLLSGIIKTLKARLQTRRGPGVLQSYRDILKLLRKGMVIPDTASWIFSAAPYVVFGTATLVGLMIPMTTTHAPLSLFGGVLAVVYLLALGPLLPCPGRTRHGKLVRWPGQQPGNDHFRNRRAGHDAGDFHRRDRAQTPPI